MLYVDSKNVIRLTRGDTARFLVTVLDGEGEEYTVQPDDVVRFTIKTSTLEPEAIVRKQIIGDANIYIAPEDTENLSYGKYVYDVEITTAIGDVYTVIEPTTFEIMPEVTW